MRAEAKTGSREKQIAQLVDNFMVDLTRALSVPLDREYSADEMRQQMKGLVSFLRAISQRWSLAILFLLYMRSLSFNELKGQLPGISSRTLTDKLRMLERSGLLTRNIVSSAPVRVKYSLTTRGREIALSCLPLLYQLRKRK